MMRYVAAAFRNIGDIPVFVFKLFGWCVIVGVGGSASVLASGFSIPITTLLVLLVGFVGLAPLLVLQPWLLKWYATSGRNDTVLGLYLVRLIAAGFIYQVIVSVAMLFFILPGLYVSFRLLSYLPRVARGEEVIDALEASWQDGSGEVVARFFQGFVYGVLSHIVVAVFAVPGILWLSRLSANSSVPFEFVIVFAGVGGVAALFVQFVATTAFMAGTLESTT